MCATSGAHRATPPASGAFAPTAHCAAVIHALGAATNPSSASEASSSLCGNTRTV